MLPATLLAIAIGMPLTELEGDGNMYVFAHLGSWSDPFCQEGRTTYFGLAEFLEGVDDYVLCIDGSTDAQSLAETRVELREDGFTAHINGWGDAVGLGIHDAFSRHDIQASMEVAAVEDLRIRIDWFVLAAGLGTVQVEIRRLGDIDGPNDPSAPIVDRGASSYIDPIMLDGTDVLRMPAGRWRISMFSTHQAMDTKPGFMHSFARSNHIATFVPLGDVNGDGSVNVGDLLSVISSWGACKECLADLDGDGLVAVDDLLMVLSDWSR